MRKTLIALVLLAAPAAMAQSPPVCLLGGPLICDKMSTAAELYACCPDKNFKQRVDLTVQRGMCVIPNGTPTYLAQQERTFSCLQPVGVGVCEWTVLVPKQAKQFGITVPTRVYLVR